MTESTVYTQRTYVLSNPDESSVVHTQRSYVLSNPDESSVVLSQRNYVLSNPNESSVVLSQRVYIVSVDTEALRGFEGGGGTGTAAPTTRPRTETRVNPSPSRATPSSRGVSSAPSSPSFSYSRKQDELVVFRAKSATAISQSPFTYKQQVFKHFGERWEVDITIPSSQRDSAQEWAARLVALRGSSGTILIGDPDHPEPRGTATAMTVTGNAGDETITVNSLNGSLLAGDRFQLGSGTSSRLHMVLVNKPSGAGTLEIWPPLRTSYSSASATLSEPKGTFRLASNVTEWSIDNASTYGISFSAVEDLT